MNVRTPCAALAAIGLLACSSSGLDTSHDLVVSGDVGGGEGKAIHVALRVDGDGQVLKALTATVVDSSFQVAFKDVLEGTIDDEASTRLRLDFFVDLDVDSTCDPPPTDLVWTYGDLFQEWSEDLTLDRDWSTATQTSAACASF